MKLSAHIKRWSAVTAAITVSAVALAACGGSGDSADGGERDTITIATSNDAPFSFVKDGKLTGIDGEMINAIAKENGWKVEVFTTVFSTLIAALKAKKADVIVDAMYVTDERKKEIDFTDTWYTQGEAMIVPAESTITSRDELQGKVLGGQTGTAFADFIKGLKGGEIKLFDSQAALIQGIANGQVDAAFTDSAVVSYSLVQNPNDKIKIVEPYEPFFPGTIGAGVRKDDTALLTELNKGLVDLKASPRYVEILKKYGLTEANAAK
ncbi:MAG: amino acid ABC transporter substrate-binding protein [Kineosporiaceae bacterium]|nr:amino acid ABC transporter substrate-binding protein [Aeromicrobium sp.]